MNRYLQSSRTSLLDLATFQFIKSKDRKRPFEVSVPFYFWEFKEPEEHRVITVANVLDGLLKNAVSLYRRVSAVQLNDLTIDFIEGFEQVAIKFFDIKRGQPSSILLKCYPHVKSMPSVSREPFLESVEYKYVINHGSPHQINDEMYMSLFSAPSFRFMAGLADAKAAIGPHDKFFYGLAPGQYDIKYKDKWLDGKCYALVCGPWAILLTDDLKFDSLVSLLSATSVSLIIHRIIYTTNTYVTKVAVLGGRR